jgi:coenzyme F420-reducing hydrogenase alpha subunit
MRSIQSSRLILEFLIKKSGICRCNCVKMDELANLTRNFKLEQYQDFIRDTYNYNFKKTPTQVGCLNNYRFNQILKLDKYRVFFLEK